jgi:hypothetical protein
LCERLPALRSPPKEVTFAMVARSAAALAKPRSATEVGQLAAVAVPVAERARTTVAAVVAPRPIRVPHLTCSPLGDN